MTDDDRWKTFFLYGYGFEAKLGVEMCPRTAEMMRQIPGMTTAMFSILSPRKHILDHRGPYKGVLRYHLGPDRPAGRRGVPDKRGRRLSPLGRGPEHDLRRHLQPRGLERHRRDAVVLFVDVLRPLPFPSRPSTGDRQGDRLLPVRPRCQTQPGSWERRYRERSAATPPLAATPAAQPE